MNNKFENLPAAVTVDSLKESHGAENGERFYHKIAQIGGFGDYRNADFVGGCPALDLKGMPDEVGGEPNPAKVAIAELLKKKETIPPVNPSAKLPANPATTNKSEENN